MPASVSVVIATRNRTSLLERALRSVSRQTLQDFEAIVVDDGSRPEVVCHHQRLLAELGDRFRLIGAASPSDGTGPAATRNRGVRAARGEFVAFLDDDDEWVAPEYLRWAVEAAAAREADYVFGDVEGCRDGVLQTPGWVPDPELLKRGTRVAEDPPIFELSSGTVALVARRFMIHPSNSLIRRETLIDVGAFFEGLWSHGEDLNLMLRVLDRARRVLYVAKTVTRYRLPTDDSVSLTEQETVHSLQRIMAAQHARLSCQRPELRTCARTREAWTYRELAAHALADGHARDGRAFAWQAFATNPSAGAAWFVLANLVRSLSARPRVGPPGVS